MTTLAIYDGSAELQKRCEETSKKLRAEGKHILDGGGNYDRNGYRLIRIPEHMLDEFIEHTNKAFKTKWKSGYQQVTK